jgi:hypothetical protein
VGHLVILNEVKDLDRGISRLEILSFDKLRRAAALRMTHCQIARNWPLNAASSGSGQPGAACYTYPVLTDRRIAAVSYL